MNQSYCSIALGGCACGITGGISAKMTGDHCRDHTEVPLIEVSVVTDVPCFLLHKFNPLRMGFAECVVCVTSEPPPSRRELNHGIVVMKHCSINARPSILCHEEVLI
ncbi:hypothetical protein EGR_05779 [Echinococcus granulosus]|uniref:Uncharacterized protein n=1 Tax=Echinococcus granulosus TaxID=6210 RepID=W6UD98_ECHGR|nr:hypothetical protein EGR_05779 [Echinococcus granulosus]EUB59295.1 hypothetical protein EGR_05779 [Echinococcus granulosus]